jgi:hypothetical protein
MRDKDQQLRLQQFWGTAIFTLGVLWGFANLIYCPVAALTSIVGSSWFEVFIIAAGGALSFCASIGAFYRRRLASRLLLAGGIVLLLLAILGQATNPDHAHGIVNLFLLFASGAIAAALGIFGIITDRKKWPPLRGSRKQN